MGGAACLSAVPQPPSSATQPLSTLPLQPPQSPPSGGRISSAAATTQAEPGSGAGVGAEAGSRGEGREGGERSPHRVGVQTASACLSVRSSPSQSPGPLQLASLPATSAPSPLLQRSPSTSLPMNRTSDDCPTLPPPAPSPGSPASAPAPAPVLTGRPAPACSPPPHPQQRQHASPSAPASPLVSICSSLQLGPTRPFPPPMPQPLLAPSRGSQADDDTDTHSSCSSMQLEEVGRGVSPLRAQVMEQQARYVQACTFWAWLSMCWSVMS